MPPTYKRNLNSGSVPFFIAEILFAWVYFVFVVRWIPVLFATHHLSTALVQLLLFHLFFILTQVSFFKTTFTDPGEIPDGFMENSNTDTVPESESSSSGLISPAVVVQMNRKGERRRCTKCTKMKPDRTHHCSQCKRCVLKMDHHCPWVNNCVGFYNYKFFVLFLTWTVILGLFVAICFLDPTFQLFSAAEDTKTRDPLIFVTFILAAVFGVGLALFAITHYAYVFMNQTTIEVMEKSKNRAGNLHNLGWKKNFREVFGDNPLLWFVPVFTSKGDGLSFPIRSDLSPLSQV